VELLLSHLWPVVPIKKEQVVDFLAALVRHLGQPLADRVGSFCREHAASRLSPGVPLLVCRAGFPLLIFHPTRGTEPRRVYLGVIEAARVAECLPKDYWQLSETARRTLRRMPAVRATDHRLLEAIFFYGQNSSTIYAREVSNGRRTLFPSRQSVISTCSYLGRESLAKSNLEHITKSAE